MCFVTNSFKGRTVLVVEDDWLLREDLVGDLRREGWTVLEAATGASAIAALRKSDAIDVLITDIRLADAVTGWDVAEAFRTSYPRSPVIYASGNPPNHGRLVKDSWFLSKPTSVSQIMLAYRDLIATGTRSRARKQRGVEPSIGRADHPRHDAVANDEPMPQRAGEMERDENDEDLARHEMVQPGE